MAFKTAENTSPFKSVKNAKMILLSLIKLASLFRKTRSFKIVTNIPQIILVLYVTKDMSLKARNAKNQTYLIVWSLILITHARNVRMDISFMTPNAKKQVSITAKDIKMPMNAPCALLDLN